VLLSFALFIFFNLDFLAAGTYTGLKWRMKMTSFVELQGGGDGDRHLEVLIEITLFFIATI
jgi:hypothetical protein